MAYNSTIGHFTAGQDFKALTEKSFTATAGQTSYSIPEGYQIGYTYVWLNGILLSQPDITATDGNTITFPQPLSAGDEVRIISFKAFGTVGVSDISGLSDRLSDVDAVNRNYVSNPNANQSTAGWSTYADAAAALPVDGTGGSAAISFSRSTASPLRGAAEFVITKDGVSRQGQGVSTDFTIDRSDLAQVLTISFDYEVLSGTYTSGDLAVYIIQDPNGTPVVVQPVGHSIQSVGIGYPARFSATFQTAYNVTSYRLCVHVASTSALNYSLGLDNVRVGPQSIVRGAPITDWQSFTPTGSWTTNATYTGRWRRVGDKMEVEWQVATSGAPNSTALTLNIPSGYAIDTAKLLDTVSGEQPLGRGSALDTGVAYYPNLLCRYSSATTIDLLVDYQGSGGNVVYTAATPLTQSAPFTFGAGDKVWASVTIPVLGWSSAVTMSTDSDQRVVAARYVSGPTQALPASVATLVNTPTKSFDTHSAFNTATNLFTVPVAGIYRVTGRVGFTAAPAAVLIMAVYKNGATGDTMSGVTSASGEQFRLFGSILVECKAGDTLGVQAFSGVATTINTADNSWIDFERLSGPSTIAASESVTARYSTAAGQSIPNGTATIVNFGTKDFDSHGMVTTGASWSAKVPASGKYLVTATVTWTPADYNPNKIFYLQIFKDGVSHSVSPIFTDVATATVYPGGTITTLVDCVAGTSIDIRAYQDNGAATTLYSFATSNYVSIHRVGN